MSSFQPFVQTDVTHITVEGAVLVDTEREIETSLCRYLLEHNMIRWETNFELTLISAVFLLDKLQ